jgi:hypothetical protein
MIYSLDLHDATISNNGIYLLKQIKEHYPKFKVSLFFVPVDKISETIAQARMQKAANIQLIKDNLDWIELLPHGLMHIPREFENCDRHTMKMVFQSIDEAFTSYGLPYKKIFCAPYWLWNQDVVDVLDENGWAGASDRNQPNMLKTKKNYTYDYSISEPFEKADDEIIKLHGHIDGESENDLERCFLKLFQCNRKADWKFVSELL